MQAVVHSNGVAHVAVPDVHKGEVDTHEEGVDTPVAVVDNPVEVADNYLVGVVVLAFVPEEAVLHVHYMEEVALNPPCFLLIMFKFVCSGISKLKINSFPMENYSFFKVSFNQ